MTQLNERNGEIWESHVEVDNMDMYAELFGAFDENLNTIRHALAVELAARDTHLVISGPDERKVEIAEAVIRELIYMLRRRERIDKSKIRYAIELASEGNAEHISDIMSDVVAVTHRGKQIKSRTLGQKRYIEALRKNTVVLAIGPAGTGKTYLAMAMAVLALKNKEVERIILTRPAVEAGERLGFLPGDLIQKVDPYLRPLYDALYDLMGVESYQRLVEKGAVEVAPLAYMRGRTLSDSFIILDEAQNTTREQMKMFLTRFGEGSRVVVTGDITQIDLPQGVKSGLVQAVEVLRGIEGIDTVRLTHRDVVRHELVQAIVKAYDAHDKRKG